ncbi:cell wall-binding repeat-containing protein [Catenulispora pinisilvae]|uniref:cell wall-binding repeat-containing protein n=1 Tax=Catenulispora pinisilvae TaxID=2705253 RepID=UPI0018925337|nr:cell wall-binding repeat-containing protein [Catenulispora pinisilvae]
MPKHPRRRSLTLSAILSSALLPAFALAAPSAHAVNPGPAGNMLTISDGTSTVLVAGRPVTFPSTVTDATWAPDGSRLAFVDGAGDLVSALPDGTGTRVLAHGGPGIVISSPTWSSDGLGVAFAESVGGHTGAIKVAKTDGYGNSASGGGDGSVVVDAWDMNDGGSYSAPDAVYIPDGTAPGRNIIPNYVFQETPAGGSTPEIRSLLNASPGQQYKIADGTQPTVSPDGRTVAFLTPDEQIAVVDVSDPFKPSQPRILTTDISVHKQHPTFSPDGDKITYEALDIRNGAPDAPKDVESIPVTGGAATIESTHPGVPAYRPEAVTHVTRLAGPDRVGTAIAVSQAEFPDPGTPTSGPSGLLLARSDQYADALAGSVLAKNAPLLLTPSTTLDAAVRAEIVRVLGPAQGTDVPVITLLGGPQALSPAVEKAVAALGYPVRRLGGPDRFATAVDIARADLAVHPYDRKFVVATGENFADALSASATGDPILLTDDQAMPAATAAFLKSAATPTSAGPATFYAVGGQARAATAKLWPHGPAGAKTVPLSGTDRYETSFLVAREFFGATPTNPGRVYLGVATATNWPDSLAGGAAMSNLPGPMLLVNPKTGLSPEEQQWVSANAGAVDSALVFGGPDALSSTVDAQLGDTLSGPAGFTMATDPASIPE